MINKEETVRKLLSIVGAETFIKYYNVFEEQRFEEKEEAIDLIFG